ncbi:hypothetical protein KIL84_016716 [Mauremys mutica]|uniref:Uncharacterized protein n=1 Tax=Mauremys mutica TaxID=74926 RepID=A0A9D3X512_9SAUR|nr:hypothetical protein KIL84_016716 [Mauremys mutica]
MPAQAKSSQKNKNKKTVTAFHLDNRSAKCTLKVIFSGNTVRHEPTPTYLRLKLDRMLTLHDLKKIAGKKKTRVNLVQKTGKHKLGDISISVNQCCELLRDSQSSSSHG